MLASVDNEDNATLTTQKVRTDAEVHILITSAHNVVLILGFLGLLLVIIMGHMASAARRGMKDKVKRPPA